MKKVSKTVVKIILSVLGVFFAILANTVYNFSSVDAGTVDGNLKSFITFSSPILYNSKRWFRDINNNNPSQIESQDSFVEQYSSGTDPGTGQSTFIREIKQAPYFSDGGQYIETYLWDATPSVNNPTILYITRASLNGDSHPNDPNWHQPNLCSSSDVSGCDYALSAGQEWLWNENASDSQGTSSSPSFRQWDSSTIGRNQGLFYYQKNLATNQYEFRFSNQYKFCGQVWYRNNWNTASYAAYVDGTNTAENLNWPDLGTTGDPGITLNPKYVYIVRQYAGCSADTDCSQQPWQKCTAFEDHVFAKDANLNPLGEVIVLAGYTPKYFGTNAFGVIDAYVKKNRAN